MSDYWVAEDGTEMRADLPVHLRMGVTMEGRGPCDPPDPEFDHYACWCGTPGCERYEDAV